jgi:hypothetical protein
MAVHGATPVCEPRSARFMCKPATDYDEIEHCDKLSYQFSFSRDY